MAPSLKGSGSKLMDKLTNKKKSAVSATVFRKDSKEFKHLVDLFKRGQISHGDQPASVKSKCNDMFSQFTTGQFRAQFHNAKKEAGGFHGKFVLCTPNSWAICLPPLLTTNAFL